MTAERSFCGTFRPLGAGWELHNSAPNAELGIVAADAGVWQAASAEGGALSLALCGEIYNAHELCQSLDLAPDTPLPEVVLAAWRRWSAGLLPRLDGVFALVLRDDDELLLYRDPSGLRNLHLQERDDGTVAFASHLGALPRPPGLRQRLARRSLHEYLRFLEVAPPHTLLQGVTAVEAGQALRWTGRGPATVVPLPPAPAADAALSFPTAVDGLDARLQRSVKLRLQGAARPAAFLSGGIDSALLCALAARRRSDLTAVTVGFEGAAYDEAPVAQRIAGHLGIRHEVLRFSRGQFLGAFERLSRYAEQPMADPAAMATVLVFEHCSNRFDAVLDGTGADEAVGAMPPRHVRLAVGHASRLPRGLRLRAADLMLASSRLASYAPVLDFDHPADTMSRWHGFTREEIEQLCGEPVSLEHTHFFRTFYRYPRRAHFDRYSALLNAMTSDRLNQALEITYAPVRFPFWDAETNQFIRQLRTDYRYLPGQPKRILRALLASYVPAQIWELPKHGFNFPLHEFLAGDDFRLVRQHLAPMRWQGYKLLKVQQVQHFAQQFLAGNERVTFRVWALVVLGAWLEQHEDQLDFGA